MDKKRIVKLDVMKKVILFVFLSFWILSSFFNNKDIEELKKIEGIYVVKYKKNEIESFIYNENLRKEGKSYERAIDFYSQSFFLSFEDETDFVNQILNWDSFNQKDFYFLPFNSRTQDYMKKFLPNKVDLLKMMDYPKKENCTFYQIPNDDVFLYRIYFIHGTEITIKLENTGLNRVKLDISSDAVVENEKTFNAHFINEVKKISCNENLLSLKNWNPR